MRERVAAEGRRARIVELAQEHGIVRITDLVEDLNVSTMTIRRDLAVLAERGVIDKVYGGGILRRDVDGPAPWRSAAAQAPAQAGVVETLDSSRDGQGNATAHVAIVVPTGHYYFPTVVAGIRRVLDARTVRRSLAVTRYEAEQDRILVQDFCRSGSTGLILAPDIALDEDDPERLGWLLELPVPTVLVERTMPSTAGRAALCSVRTDHELGCDRAVSHLASLGHRGVGLVTQGASQTKSRVRDGWRRAVERSGMDPTLSPLITTSPQANLDLWPASEAVDLVLDEIAAAQVTAVLVHSDQTALALVHHARQRGWQIPADLSVVAYDDEIAEMADPPLAAVSPPKEWVGEAAARLLLDLVAEGGRGPVRHVVAEPRLVLRESTAQPRAAALR